MLLFVISEITVGLSLSIYSWKSLPDQYFNSTLLSLTPGDDYKKGRIFIVEVKFQIILSRIS